MVEIKSDINRPMGDCEISADGICQETSDFVIKCAGKCDKADFVVQQLGEIEARRVASEELPNG